MSKIIKAQKVEFILKNIIDACIKHRNFSELGLLTGHMGISYFLLNCASYLGDIGLYKKGIEALNSTIDMIMNSKSISSDFCSGLAGIGFALNSLEKNNIITIEITDEIDVYLQNAVKHNCKTLNYDYLYGVIGMGLYFLSKNKFDKEDKTVIYDILEFLQKSALIDDSLNTAKWNSLFVKKQNEKTVFDLSLAHGISGIILFLCKVNSLGIEQSQTEKLIEQSINYILAQEIDASFHGSNFPYVALETEKATKSRLAWCYGDLGIAFAIWRSGICLRRDIWKNKAIDIFLFACNRIDLGENLVLDASFCHGASGVAQMFYKMYSETQFVEFKNAYNFWINETIKMSNLNADHIEYKYYFDANLIPSDYSLLEGLPGIGLVLLSYLTNSDSTWDECFLLS